MAAILEIAKRYLFEILCGVGAALGIALGLFGMSAMSSVTEAMTEAVDTHGKISRLAQASNPINEQAVNLEQERIDQIKNDFSRTIEFAKELNAFDPLVARVFPTSRSPERIAFQRAYRAEVATWLGILRAGDVPTEDDVAAWQDRIEAAMPADTGFGSDETGPGQDTENGSDDDNSDGGSGPHRSGLVSDKQARTSPEVRAAIDKALSIYLYATADSFQESKVSAADGPMFNRRPPKPEEMWHAQLEVWIQRDIVDAIARINKKAAQQLTAAGETPWVGNLPIKELISIQTTTGDYYLIEKADGKLGSKSAPRSEPPGGYTRVAPPGSSLAAFTKNKSTKLYELMQFSIKLIADGRDLPGIISQLCEDRFLTPLRVAYVAQPVDLSMEGKIYGDEPVVNVVIDFETVFLSQWYLPLMPDETLEKLGKKRPEPKEKEGA